MDYASHPLPAHWEQKYDSETKRFFFIDHSKKITTWIDPRLEICKRDNQGAATPKQPPVNAVTSRDKKAKTIHKKFPKMTLDKITSLLADNYDNVSSVEGILQREQQVADQLEQAETSKRIADELQKKAEKEERDNRMKELVNQKAQQSAKGKVDDEAKKLKDSEVRIKQEATVSVDDSNNQPLVVNNANIDDDSRTREDADIIRDASNEDSLKRVDINAQQTKTKLNKGPNKALFNGANPGNKLGPNIQLLASNRSILAKGANPANRFGPRSDLKIKASN